jgi:hypothetical protein
MQVERRLLHCRELTMFTLELCCSTTLGHMIIHRVLLLLADGAIRAAEIVVRFATGVAGTSCGLTGRVTAAHLGVAVEAEPQVLACCSCSSSSRSRSSSSLGLVTHSNW